MNAETAVRFFVDDPVAAALRAPADEPFAGYVTSGRKSGEILQRDHAGNLCKARSAPEIERKIESGPRRRGPGGRRLSMAVCHSPFQRIQRVVSSLATCRAPRHLVGQVRTAALPPSGTMREKIVAFASGIRRPRPPCSGPWSRCADRLDLGTGEAAAWASSSQRIQACGIRDWNRVLGPIPVSSPFGSVPSCRRHSHSQGEAWEPEEQIPERSSKSTSILRSKPSRLAARTIVLSRK